MITLVDYGVGNPAAIKNMMRHIGVACQLTADPERILTAERLLLPGVGHYDHCFEQLDARNLVGVLNEAACVRRTPLLGICVGAQLLGHGSEEGSAPGLGWLDFTVRRLPAGAGVRVPHMGWAEVEALGDAPLFTPPAERLPRFYFAHSYYISPDPGAEGLAMGRTRHGIDYTSAVRSSNILGVQFHPEKSHLYGMDVLRRFAGWTP